MQVLYINLERRTDRNEGFLRRNSGSVDCCRINAPEGKAIEFIYEQPPAQLLETLLPRYVEIAIYQALLESGAAQQAARMTAMDAATSNASEMIDNLTLYMNRVRQASITREIIEVVSGAAGVE